MGDTGFSGSIGRGRPTYDSQTERLTLNCNPIPPGLSPRSLGSWRDGFLRIELIIPNVEAGLTRDTLPCEGSGSGTAEDYGCNSERCVAACSPHADCRSYGIVDVSLCTARSLRA